jgi:hypothetical protein
LIVSVTEDRFEGKIVVEAFGDQRARALVIDAEGMFVDGQRVETGMGSSAAASSRSTRADNVAFC